MEVFTYIERAFQLGASAATILIGYLACKGYADYSSYRKDLEQQRKKLNNIYLAEVDSYQAYVEIFKNKADYELDESTINRIDLIKKRADLLTGYANYGHCYEDSASNTPLYIILDYFDRIKKTFLVEHLLNHSRPFEKIPEFNKFISDKIENTKFSSRQYNLTLSCEEIKGCYLNFKFMESLLKVSKEDIKKSIKNQENIFKMQEKRIKQGVNPYKDNPLLEEKDPEEILKNYRKKLEDRKKRLEWIDEKNLKGMRAEIKKENYKLARKAFNTKKISEVLPALSLMKKFYGIKLNYYDINGWKKELEKL